MIIMDQHDRKRLKRLKDYYNIRGDGVARLNIREASSDETLKENIFKIKDLPLNGETQNES